MYICRNHKSVSAETTNLYLLKPNYIYTGSTSVIVSNMMDLSYLFLEIPDGENPSVFDK